MRSSSLLVILTAVSSLLMTRYSFSVSVLNHLATPEITPENEPWFTGPLLAPSAHTIPPHHCNIEPYLYFFGITGSYNQDKTFVSKPNFYILQEQLNVQIGLLSFLDCQLIPSLFYQFTQGERSAQAGDIPLSIGIQLCKEKPKSHLPAIKLSLRASAPTGKYQNLNPEDLGTDGVGTGSWLPSIGLAFSRLYQCTKTSFFSPRFSFNYTIPGSVPVKGVNVYGGAPDTRAKVHVGHYFSCNLGMEYNFSRHWAAAMDIHYAHRNKSRFSGFPGTLASLGGPAGERLSLAPAIEYNWSINIGLIAGVWFSVFGKNSDAFTSGVIALNIYH